ncbi:MULTISPECIES: hypothetical protein [Exiguobacterium]|uniref:Uncharacterized protein n=1 Tax=Exiguobacterium chiriqhucha RW-2 TaxID=1345023 RepID=U1M0L5_9BACL|nr:MULTISPECIES: hypothetical protein [Exiguobacterium]ERG68202.1 hypothetical protein M467_13045 [Exiguobacterium chiriqhucha RW-2]
MAEHKIKHLEFIQQTISRMASNSFYLKGWAVTLVAAILAFANVKDMDSRYIYIALIPTIFFWFLDGFYLHQEKLFRKLYDVVRIKSDETIDYSMDTSDFKKDIDSWLIVCFSKTLLMFYFSIIIAIFLAICLSKN